MQLPPPRRPGAYRIAIVCLGNICRSPMAHVVLAEHGSTTPGSPSGSTVDSSGTGDWHVGDPMDRRAAATLTAEGYDADRHRARSSPRRRPRTTTWCWPWTPTTYARPRATLGDDARRADVPRLRPGDPGRRRRTRSVLRRRRRLRRGPGHGGAHRRPRSSTAATARPTMTRAVRDRPPGRGAARRRGRRDRAGGRRRHLHRHPAPAQRRPTRADQDASRTRRRASSRPRPAGCAGSREVDGGVAVPEVLAVDHDCLIIAVGRARQADHRGGRRVRPRARRHPPAGAGDVRRGARRLHRPPPAAQRDRADLGGVLRDPAGAALPQGRRATAAAIDRRARPPRSRPWSGGSTTCCPRSRPPGCTATCGPATCSGAPTARVLADRPGGVRRPPRDRPGDARPVRRCRTSRACWTPTTRRTRWPTAGRTGRRCTSCSRCSCTPACSAARTAPGRPRSRAGGSLTV